MSAEFTWEQRDLHLRGHWTLEAIASLEAQLAPQPAAARVHGTALTSIDSAGALLLLTRFCAADTQRIGFSPAAEKLIELIVARRATNVAKLPRAHGLLGMLERAGIAMVRAKNEALALLGFTGLVLERAVQVALGRRRLRLTATVFHMERAGLDAVPIVCLLSFLVGAVVAFLGATVLADFGAAVLTVELVTYSFLREFGVLLTAILLAGRSGSAFTAEIGMMRAREEIDAIRALGLDPIELLVLPRTLALIVMLPLVAFLAVLAGILGGALVGSLSLGISPGLFLARLQEAAELRHFFVGMIKAPVFALLIALTACRQGLSVSGSAEAVGRHTTASVVQAIFLVILFDALFAILFREIGW